MSDEQTIFNEAIEKPTPQERDRFLSDACGDDQALRGRVELLIAAHERAGGFLETPPTAVVALEQSRRDGAGAMIGPYKLLEQIGEGGMGAVYMAEQTRPIRRRVALKIIKPGLDTRQVIARFEAERQALAMMDHPNIAKVFDAGATDSGRSYFVMELVKGIPITDYCDQNQLSPRQRLELFIQVCTAVQHAHQKGIIHRDIKPTNVLVTVADDGKPVPKVIDFGIAKATTGQPLTEMTVFTQFRQLVGTPLYMSPEQAQMNTLEDVDTRSDVYSLGVLLYELLTGTTPFDKQRLAKAAYDEVRRIIRNEEPPRPSTRISALGETLTTISARRHTDPRKLSSIVRGELDWIVMRALEKDRARRYETAVGLAHDVERYLADQPVEACPPSRVYRLRIFARRNKAVMTMVAIILIVLVVATSVSTWQAMRATRAGREARRQEQLATLEAEKQQAINRFLNDMLQRANPRGSLPTGSRRGRAVTVLEVLNEAVRKLDEGSLSKRPEIEWSLRRTIGSALGELGEKKAAEAQMRKASQLSEKAYGAEHQIAIEVRRNLANTLVYTHGDEAAALCRENIAIARSRSGDHTMDITNNLITLGIALRVQKKLAEAEVATREALTIRETAYGKGSVSLTFPVSSLAKVLHEQGKLSEAEAMYRRGIELVRAKLPTTDDESDRTALATQLEWFARLLTEEGKLSEAESVRREILGIRRKWYAEESPEVSASLSALLGTLREEGKESEIEKLWRETLDGRKAALTAAETPERRASLYASLYRPLLEIGQYDEAKAALRKAVAIHPSSAAPVLNEAAWTMATSVEPTRRDEACALELAEALVAVVDRDAMCWNTLGVARYRAGQWNKAIEALEKSRQMQEGKLLSWDAFFLAMSHWRLGQQSEARRCYDQAVAWTATSQIMRSSLASEVRRKRPSESGPRPPRRRRQRPPRDDFHFFGRRLLPMAHSIWAIKRLPRFLESS